MNSAFPIRSELFYSIDAVTYILSNVSILKILGMTCDNASTNDAMLDELDSMLAHFEGMKLTSTVRLRSMRQRM